MPKLYPFKFYNLSRTIKPIKEEHWFESHQSLLLRVVNTDEGRELLCLDKNFPAIERIGKNFVTGKLPDGKSITEFRIGAKWANAIRYKWPQFVELAKQFYDDKENSLTQVIINGELLWAATTSTFYPDPNPETTTVDGRVGHSTGVGSGVAWTTLVNAAGNEAADSETDHVPLHVVADEPGYTNMWRLLRRGIYLFDTSAIGDTDTITSATLSIYGNNKATAGSPPSPEVALNIYSSNPTSNTSLVGTDYATIGTTAYCATSITYTNWSTTGYNDFALNASGLSNISKTGVSKFGTRDATYDAPDSAPTWSGGSQAYVRGYFADQTGTSNDPKLVIVHNPPITPGKGDLTYTGYEPNLTQNLTVSPGKDDLTYTGYAPNPTQNTIVSPNKGTLTFTGFAATILLPVIIAIAGADTLTYTGYAPSTAGTITVTDFADGRVFQRNGTSASITISGTYSGTPSAIQARVVNDGTSTEVVTWTTIATALSGGVFSGSLTTPQGGWYNVQVRFLNDTNITSNGTNKWGVGVLVGCLGQSNMYSSTTGWFSIGTDLTADSLLRKYSASGWQTLGTTGNGAISFGNKLINALNIPVGLLNYGVDGSALRAEAATTGGYWLDTAAGSPYALFKTGFQSLGSEMEYIIWVQGERSANSGVVTEAEYETSLQSFIISQIRTDITNRSTQPNLPFIISGLGRCTTGTDANWQGVRNALYWAKDNISDVYLGSNAIELALIDVVHLTAASQTTVGSRMAQAILDILGNETYHRGPSIVSFELVSSSVIDVKILHRGGTDFTPTTGITGFAVLDSGTPETITSAVRQTATTVRLTISGTIAGTPSVRYQYGANPTITGAIIDNSGMLLPLEMGDNIIQNFVLYPANDSFAYSGQIPTLDISANFVASPGKDNLVYTGQIPLIKVPIEPITGTIAYTGKIPIIDVGISLDGIYNLIETRLASASYTAPDNAGITAIKAKTDTILWTDVTSILTYAIAHSKWKNNKLARTSINGNTETWVLYDDDSSTPLLTWTHDTSNVIRTKAI